MDVCRVVALPPRSRSWSPEPTCRRIFSSNGDSSLAEPGQPAERLFTLRTTGNFFALFGVGPLLGRTYSDAADQTGAPEVTVLSYGFWQRRFNGDPNVIGRSIRLDGRNAWRASKTDPMLVLRHE